MRATGRRPRQHIDQPESAEALRKRLAAFAVMTRDMALRRGKVEEPTVQGPVLNGRRRAR